MKNEISFIINYELFFLNFWIHSDETTWRHFLTVLFLSVLQQPHHIIQKRLLETKMSRGRVNMCGVSPNNGQILLSCTHFNSNEDEEEEEEDFIYVPSKVSLYHKVQWTVLYFGWNTYFFLIGFPSAFSQCLGHEVNLLIDTGCKLNLMSSVTVERLGWDVHDLSIWFTSGHLQYSMSDVLFLS